MYQIFVIPERFGCLVYSSEFPEFLIWNEQFHGKFVGLDLHLIHGQKRILPQEGGIRVRVKHGMTEFMGARETLHMLRYGSIDVYLLHAQLLVVVAVDGS